MEHLTQKQFEEYARQQLQPVELLTVADHLSECELCRQNLDARMQSDATFLALRAQVFDGTSEPREHLTTEQMADYVERSFSGEQLQLLSDHLSACESCSLAVADLRDFRNEIAPSLDREYGPQPTVAPVKGWWRRTFAALPTFFRAAPVPAFGGVALAVLLLAMIGWSILRKQSEQHPNQQAAVVPGPSVQPVEVPSPLPTATALVAVVAQLNDGGRVLTVDQQGKLSGAESLPAEYQNRIRQALVNQRIERAPELKGLTRSSSSLMGSDNETNQFSVSDPVGVVVMSDHPTFRWSPMEGASYVVEVYDSKFNPVAKSLQLTGNSWTPPQALPRGETYSWQVKAAKAGQEVTSPRPPAPQARFRILDQAKTNELAKAKRAYGSSHLTLALLYADAGLLKESEQELRLLLQANPDSALARNLLRQVRALQH